MRRTGCAIVGFPQRDGTKKEIIIQGVPKDKAVDVAKMIRVNDFVIVVDVKGNIYSTSSRIFGKSFWVGGFAEHGWCRGHIECLVKLGLINGKDVEWYLAEAKKRAEASDFEYNWKRLEEYCKAVGIRVPKRPTKRKK